MANQEQMQAEAIAQANSRSDREFLDCFVFVDKATTPPTWYVRTASEGFPKGANLVCTALAPRRFKIEPSGSDWNVIDLKTKTVLVSRESYAVADRICERANNANLDDFSEATEVARRIREWAATA